MKKINVYFLILVFSVILGACSRENHVIGGKTSIKQLDVNSRTFLESHKELDTAALLFALAGFEEDINGASTVFVPNNLTLKKFINTQVYFLELASDEEEAVFDLYDIPQDTLYAYLGSYILPDVLLTREDMTEEGEFFTMLNGDQRRVALREADIYEGYLPTRASFVYFETRRDEWDIEPGGDDYSDIVRTSNLRTTNGVLHVLQGSTILRKKETE